MTLSGNLIIWVTLHCRSQRPSAAASPGRRLSQRVLASLRVRTRAGRNHRNLGRRLPQVQLDESLITHSSSESISSSRPQGEGQPSTRGVLTDQSPPTNAWDCREAKSSSYVRRTPSANARWPSTALTLVANSTWAEVGGLGMTIPRISLALMFA